MANMAFLSVIHSSKHAGRGRKPRAGYLPDLGSAASGDQHPLQIFFSRAFMSASSAPIESTYLPASTFEAGAARDAGLAVGATGAAALS